MKQRLSLKVLASGPCELDFSWYDMIRDELLRRIVKQGARVLDVGCGKGGVLFELSGQIESGIGVDISTNDLASAENTRKKRDLRNLTFTEANAIELPFPSSSFDVVLCLGDVLSSSNLYGYEQSVLSEIRRVLKTNGVVVYQCDNWDWEYRLTPYWTFFTRKSDGSFYFHRSKRKASGLEMTRSYRVVSQSPLHQWILQQQWPESLQGDRTSLDVIEEKPIPSCWLEYQGRNKYQYYTLRSLKRRFENSGFHNVEVFAYGQTYDIVSKAGLLQAVEHSKPRLAKAEAEMILKLRTGNGPCLFLVGTA